MFVLIGLIDGLDCCTTDFFILKMAWKQTACFMDFEIAYSFFYIYVVIHIVNCTIPIIVKGLKICKHKYIYVNIYILYCTFPIKCFNIVKLYMNIYMFEHVSVLSSLFVYTFVNMCGIISPSINMSFSYTFRLNQFQIMLFYGLDLSHKYISSALFLSCQCSCIPPHFYFAIDCLFARSLNVRFKSLSIHFYPYAKVYFHCSNRIKCPITFILWAQPSLIVHAFSSIISSSCNVCPVCFGVMDSVLKITNVFKTLVSFIVQLFFRLFQNLQECL